MRSEIQKKQPANQANEQANIIQIRIQDTIAQQGLVVYKLPL